MVTSGTSRTDERSCVLPVLTLLKGFRKTR
jgi:hypothetical protein